MYRNVIENYGESFPVKSLPLRKFLVFQAGSASRYSQLDIPTWNYRTPKAEGKERMRIKTVHL